MGSILMLMVGIVLNCFIQLTATNVDDDISSILFGPYVPMLRTHTEPSYNLDKSLFQTLENYYLNTKPTTESKYPWIAKVVHSTTSEFPFLCTASCIESRIFITSARCIASAQITLTAVIYKKTRFPAKVFVLPSHPTKQWFDDVCIIVVEPNKTFHGSWDTVQIFPGSRTDNPKNQYKWFEDLKFDSQKTKEHVVVAYAYEKFFHKMKTPQSLIKLVELEVALGIKLCEIFYNEPKSFHVPCYHHCSFEEFKNENSLSLCNKTICADGGAVYNTKSKKLIGVATWANQGPGVGIELPVGFSVPNSEDFKKDMTCARKIRDDNKVNPPKGYHQKLCP